MPAAWLKRTFERLGARRPAPTGSPQADRIDAAWARRASAASAGDLFADLRAAAGKGPLDDAAVRRLAAHLRGGFGSQAAARGGHIDEHLALWRSLAERHPLARACHADTLLAAGRADEATAELALALADDPTLLHELGEELYEAARAQGGAPWLEVRLACLRAALDVGPPGDGDGVGVDADEAAAEHDDHVRELYGELLDDHQDDAAALERVREVGRAIDGAVQRGELSRALVRRRPR